MGSSSRTKSAHPIHRLRAKKSIPRSPNPLFPFPSSSQPKILFRNSNSKLKIPPRYALSRAALRASVLRSTETHSMEQPKPETDPESQVPNGDSVAAKGSGSGSESQRTASSSGSIKKSVHWSPELVTESTFTSSPQGSRSNAYFSYSSSSSSSISQPTSTFNVMETVVTVRNVLGRWGRKVGEASRKAENLAGNTWQHLKTSPSIAEAAMGRIAQGTKVLAEGGYEKIFLSTFETVPEERLQNSFACYLSTSAGPVMGVLYLSTAKIAYSSDNPISYKSDNKTEWSYYKVVIPLHEIKAVNPSTNTANPSEKYIQVISVDNHEFWFMGFLNYDSAVDCLQDALQAGKLLQSEA